MDLKNLFRHGHAKDGGRGCKIKQTRLQEPIEGTSGKRASACTDLQQLASALPQPFCVNFAPKPPPQIFEGTKNLRTPIQIYSFFTIRKPSLSPPVKFPNFMLLFRCASGAERYGE